jgi:uncharacterized protein (TIGR02594 family)
MKQILSTLIAALSGMLVATATVEAKPNQEEKITIKKYGQTWRVTKATAISRCEASMTDPKRKNWNIYCEYVPQVVADKNQCSFLFWKTDCAIRNDEPQSPKKTPRQDDGGIAASMPGVGAKKSGFLESNNTGVLAKAESMIGLDARKDRKILKEKLSEANGQTVDPARIPWCAAWANMVLAEVGMETTGSLMARSFLAWGKAVKGNPNIGDVVVMRRGRNRNNGHVGFFYAFVDVNGAKMVAVLGGNQGKEVRISYYPISRVIAYRTAV